MNDCPQHLWVLGSHISKTEWRPGLWTGQYWKDLIWGCHRCKQLRPTVHSGIG